MNFAEVPIVVLLLLKGTSACRVKLTRTSSEHYQEDEQSEISRFQSFTSQHAEYIGAGCHGPEGTQSVVRVSVNIVATIFADFRSEFLVGTTGREPEFTF